MKGATPADPAVRVALDALAVVIARRVVRRIEALTPRLQVDRVDDADATETDPPAPETPAAD